MAVDGVCKLHGKRKHVPRPEVPDWYDIPTVNGKTREEAHAALIAQNKICTCAAGVPSFLCRVCACWGLEIGTCEPDIEALRGGTLFTAKRCKCIRWDLITDDGRLKERDTQYHCDGEYISRRKDIRGEFDEICHEAWWRGDCEAAVRAWPPPRVRFCEGCCTYGGDYVRTCDKGCPHRHVGRHIMVVGEDIAVACAIKCRGQRVQCSWNEQGLYSWNYCGVESLPDVVVYR